MHLKSLALGALLASMTAGSVACAASTLPREPYLQKVGPDTATVAFRLAANCATAQVHYGAGNTDSVAPSASSGRIHAVVLTGLTPGTPYTYQVDACGEQTATYRFVTAPTPGTRKVHFAAVGDFGTGGTDQRAVAQAMLAQRPELFLALGDNAYSSGTESEFQNNLFTPMAALLSEVPLFASPGNHEYVTSEAQPYLDNLYLPTNNPQGTERYYSFDWGHVHFVSLDSNCAVGLASSKTCTLAAQRAWAEKDLAASQQPWKVVFFHHPPWSSGEHGSQLTMRREFGPLFEKYGVDLVLTGHDHDYERSKPMAGDAVAASGERGIPYLVVGGGGASLRAFAGSRPSWSVIRDDQAHGFLDVDVTDGTLTAKLLTTGNKVLDSFTLTKQLAPPEQPPVGTLSVAVEGERGPAPLTAHFIATPPAPGVTVTWDFGDGQTAQGEQVDHTFTTPGSHTVTASATVGTQAQTATAAVTVTTEGGNPDPVTPPPETPGTDAGTTTPPPETRPTPPGNPTADASDPGGGAGGGCAASPTAALLPLAGLGLAGLLRRRRRDRR